MLMIFMTSDVIISNLTAMNQDSFSSDSFDEENFIERASPKAQYQQNPSIRSRFSILTDMSDANAFNKKSEEQTLLSRYIKDLHDEQTENPTKMSTNQSNQREYRSDQNNKNNRKEQESRNRQLIEQGWKRKNTSQCPVENAQNINRLNQKLEKSKTMKKQSESFGIFVYKMQIDLNKPIDFQKEICETKIPRNCGQSRNSSKQCQDQLLFTHALEKRHGRRKQFRQ